MPGGEIVAATVVGGCVIYTWVNLQFWHTNFKIPNFVFIFFNGAVLYCNVLYFNVRQKPAVNIDLITHEKGKSSNS